MAKYVFVTGGVVSSLGKGIASASLGMLLKRRGLKVTLQKFDPYLNVDPGTMSPFQHGEVFVTDDGAETDLDLGHYERYLDEDLTRDHNVTAGQVYDAIIARERRGDYLGRTVQVIPHVTDEIKSRITKVGETRGMDVCISEIGGTVGDIESLPFLESIRQIRLEMGRNNTVFVHLTLVPYIGAAHELKTKPTQHSVRELREIGIQPDILLCRTERCISEEARQKMALFCNVRKEAVIEAKDVESVYQVPLVFHAGGLDALVVNMLGLTCPEPDLTDWKDLVDRISHPGGEVTVAIVGKYTELRDAYKSINEAFIHAGIANDVRVETHWISSEQVKAETARNIFHGFDGLLIPGGFGERGTDGMFEAVRYARENRVPFFGICLGMQCAVIEIARNLCGLEGANSSEFDSSTAYPVIDLMPDQRNVSRLGGSMRLGAWPCHLKQDTFAYAAYGIDHISERHRHRYEFNNLFREIMTERGFVVSGTSPDGSLVEMIEISGHPWFVGCQFHPELKSRPARAHPLFREFIGAAKAYKLKHRLLVGEK
ncbi:MAG: CTP synthase [Candidatus Eisenbacteria bacterium]